MLAVKENVDISMYIFLFTSMQEDLPTLFRFYQVIAFLKQQSRGYIPKKSKVFTREELETFLDTALDEQYLLIKVVSF